MSLKRKLVVCSMVVCLSSATAGSLLAASAPEYTRASVSRPEVARGMQQPVSPKLIGSMVTSGVNLATGKPVAVRSFGQHDFIVSLADFQWARLAENGGNHLVEWRWYLGDKLVSHSKKDFNIGATPYTVRSMRAASALGVGHFKVETLVDGVVASSDKFEIDS